MLLLLLGMQQIQWVYNNEQERLYENFTTPDPGSGVVLLTLLHWSYIHSVFLFVWGLSLHSRIFHSYGEVTIAGEGLQIFTYALHLALSSEGSLVCLTYCDMGHQFIKVISKVLWHSHLLPSIWQWSCHYLFLWPKSDAAGIRTSNLLLGGPTL